MLIAAGLFSRVPEEAMVLLLMLGGVAIAVVGWLAWTGRYRGWGRRGGLIDPWTPMLLFMGAGFTLMFGTAFVGMQIDYVDQPPATLALLFGLGLVVVFWGILGAIVTMGPGDTYRKRPDGTWVTRLFLPRWYHEYLRDTFGGRPRT